MVIGMSEVHTCLVINQSDDHGVRVQLVNHEYDYTELDDTIYLKKMFNSNF